MTTAFTRALVDSALREHWNGMVVRCFLLTAHYRKPLGFSREGLRATEKSLQKLVLKALPAQPGAAPAPETVAALKDDLNTPLAFATLHALARAGRADELRAGLELMGVDINWLAVLIDLHPDRKPGA